MKIGYFDFTPYLIFDEDKQEIVKIYFPADAIIPEARIGTKAGNYFLDDLEKWLRKEQAIKKSKKV